MGAKRAGLYVWPSDFHSNGCRQTAFRREGLGTLPPALVSSLGLHKGHATGTQRGVSWAVKTRAGWGVSWTVKLFIPRARWRVCCVRTTL